MTHPERRIRYERIDIYYSSQISLARSLVSYGGEENGVSSVRGRIPFTARVGCEGVQSVFRGEENRKKKKRCRRDRRRERERERSLNLVVDVQSIVMEACKERERGRGKT